MSYRMTLIDSYKGVDVRIGLKNNGDFNIEIGELEFDIPARAAEDIAKYILQRT